jgi:hypothetical protein
MEGLRHAMPLIMAGALGLVALVLLVGLGVMVRGGAVNKKYGNWLMRARVAAQAAAVLLFLLFMYLSQGN